MKTNYENYENVDFGDKRLNKRLIKELESKTSSPEESILARHGVYGAKGVYRLTKTRSFKGDLFWKRRGRKP